MAFTVTIYTAILFIQIVDSVARVTGRVSQVFLIPGVNDRINRQMSQFCFLWLLYGCHYLLYNALWGFSLHYLLSFWELCQFWME